MIVIGDLSLAQSQLFPLRKENARIAKENHQLHMNSIKQVKIHKLFIIQSTYFFIEYSLHVKLNTVLSLNGFTH